MQRGGHDQLRRVMLEGGGGDITTPLSLSPHPLQGLAMSRPRQGWSDIYIPSMLLI